MTQTGITRDLISITVNGDERDVAEGTTVAQFLAGLGLDPRLVVVELNRRILRDKTSLAGTPLAPGDTLELVHFVGGG